MPEFLFLTLPCYSHFIRQLEPRFFIHEIKNKVVWIDCWCLALLPVIVFMAWCYFHLSYCCQSLKKFRLCTNDFILILHSSFDYISWIIYPMIPHSDILQCYAIFRIMIVNFKQIAILWSKTPYMQNVIFTSKNIYVFPIITPLYATQKMCII